MFKILLTIFFVLFLLIFLQRIILSDIIILDGDITFFFVIDNKKIYPITFFSMAYLYCNSYRVCMITTFLQQVQLMKCKYISVHLLLLNAEIDFNVCRVSLTKTVIFGKKMIWHKEYNGCIIIHSIQHCI